MRNCGELGRLKSQPYNGITVMLLPFQAVMVGDDIVSDVGGAQACGIRGLQVRTGKYRFIIEHYCCLYLQLPMN